MIECLLQLVQYITLFCCNRTWASSVRKIPQNVNSFRELIEIFSLFSNRSITLNRTLVSELPLTPQVFVIDFPQMISISHPRAEMFVGFDLEEGGGGE